MSQYTRMLEVIQSFHYCVRTCSCCLYWLGMAIEDIVIAEGPTKLFQKLERLHEILCARRVIRTKIRTEDCI